LQLKAKNKISVLIVMFTYAFLGRLLNVLLSVPTYVALSYDHTQKVFLFQQSLKCNRSRSVTRWLDPRSRSTSHVSESFEQTTADGRNSVA